MNYSTCLCSLIRTYLFHFHLHFRVDAPGIRAGTKKNNNNEPAMRYKLHNSVQLRVALDVDVPPARQPESITAPRGTRHSAFRIQFMPNEFYERLINQSSHSMSLLTAFNATQFNSIRTETDRSRIRAFSHSPIRNTSDGKGSAEGQKSRKRGRRRRWGGGAVGGAGSGQE